MLETKNVFIDTEYFVSSNLDFDKSALKEFKNLCFNSELRHITTSVVQKEIRSHISESVNDALVALKKFKRKAKILNSLNDRDVRSLFSDVDEDAILSKAIAVYDNFVSSCGTHIIDSLNINNEELLDLYFNKESPFGEKKKKSEFPDAISLLSLKEHIDKDEKVYIISGDKDLKSFCEANDQFIYLETLEYLLDLYSQHNDVRTRTVKQYFVNNDTRIKDYIIRYLEGCDAINMSSWDGAEVDEHEIVGMGDLEPMIIFIDDEEALISMDIEVELEVTVTGPNYNEGTYDREDDIIYTFGNSTVVRYIVKTYTVEVQLNYEFANGQLDGVVEDISIPGVQGVIEVDVEENEACY